MNSLNVRRRIALGGPGHKPGIQIVTRARGQPRHILKSPLICGRFLGIKEERIRLLLVNQLLPLPVDLLSLLPVELRARLLDQKVRLRIAEADVIRSAVRNRARVPDLIRILDQIGGPRAGARIEPAIPHANDEYRKLDAALGHLDSNFAELFFQNWQELLRESAAGGAEHFEPEWNSVLIANAVAIMVHPPRFVQHF